MPLDAIFISALAKELSENLAGGRIDKINQPSRPSVVFSVRGEKNTNLFLWAGASPRVYLSDSAFEKPQEPPMFCMLLRKYLSGARVTSVTQMGLDRVIKAELACSDIFGQGERRTIIIELLGRSPNLVLTDGSDIITDCLYRSGSLGEKRALLPGLRYMPPPDTGRISPLEGDIGELFAAAGDGVEIQKWLCDTFNGISPLIARELVFRSMGETDACVCHAREKDGGASFIREWEKFLDTVQNGMKPYLLRNGEGEIKDVTYMPILQYGPGYSCEPGESWSGVIEEFYSKKDVEERRRQRTAALVKQVKTKRDRVARRTALQEKDLAAAADRDTLRENGDLIISNIYQMKKGMSVLKAEDYYKGGIREIKLDPLKTPQQNAEKYYKDYTKSKTAEMHLTKLIKEGKEELSYLDSVLAELQLAGSMKDVSEIRSELETTGIVRAQPGGKKKKTAISGPTSFESPSGMKILVGKNNMQNDMLTFKTARRDDIWLHVQKIHGSHVIICCAGAEPDEETLLMAAETAAWFSAGQEGGKTAVDYTRVKFVKKPAGARPGAVVYTDYKTVYVEPREPDGLSQKGK